MKPSVKGWAVAAQQEDLKVKMGTEKSRSFEGQKQSLAYVYMDDADSKEEKKSVIGELIFFADRELCQE